ncbi:MAG: glycosyltransferase [Fulvimarina manganoxydans]|uniref:glycosyltransferase family 2 protein n=1 Tax=Fulvimarina manganoxydans TaxID=937218 RepID=UPI002355172B|nr:galactosyltransferase-related protein [Fulvimarina manganoxydans]MCK5932681.1 glycosyltransferase [Fulvimarina manganoxydans]
MSLSVLTLVRGRRDHLVNLMQSLSAQTRRPDELVIAFMQETIEPDLPAIGLPVRALTVTGQALPLAKARNRAAAAAKGDTLVFLDVDCIASPTLVESFERAATSERGLFLGEVLYLPEGAATGPLDMERLDAVGIAHPSKPSIPETGLRREPDAGEFWGLSFALRRSLWNRLGGMDERFIGYGGEETDLAARLDRAGVPVWWTAGARAYHQHHTVHIPPLNHFGSIIRNARRFHEKHGRWCMTYWLGQFAERGLIAWSEEAGEIVGLCEPDAEMIAAARQPGHVRFS